MRLLTYDQTRACTCTTASTGLNPDRLRSLVSWPPMGFPNPNPSQTNPSLACLSLIPHPTPNDTTLTLTPNPNPNPDPNPKQLWATR